MDDGQIDGNFIICKMFFQSPSSHHNTNIPATITNSTTYNNSVKMPESNQIKLKYNQNDFKKRRSFSRSRSPSMIKSYSRSRSRSTHHRRNYYDDNVKNNHRQKYYREPSISPTARTSNRNNRNISGNTRRSRSRSVKRRYNSRSRSFSRSR